MINIENAYNRPSIKKARCKKCKKMFNMDKKRGWCFTRAIVEVIQINNFRGDDVVNFYHTKCFNSK